MSAEMILRGTGFGPMQSVGQMQVIPLTAPSDESADDATYAPPELEVGTHGYGSVLLRNTHDKPTIVPYGAGWVVKQAAQDHAIASSAFLEPGAERIVSKAMCIQQTQPGLIKRAKHALTILPARLRAKALAMRHVDQYSKLWEHITSFNKDLGIEAAANLVTFLSQFQKQLDEFVAEFELIPRQIGAIVLVSGEVVGIERAPSAAYFAATWEPLIRVCYGSLAVGRRADSTPALPPYESVATKRREPPRTRLPFLALAKTIDALRAALEDLRAREAVLTKEIVDFVHTLRMERADEADDTLGDAQLWTVAGNTLGGQIVTRGDAVPYASLVLA